jgi:methionyl-tRNA formyltransferase
MRVIFAGTPEFARVALARLLAAGFTVPLVLTQPDRPAMINDGPSNCSTACF